MSKAPISVHLISGFLGSGKTTFLNRILRQVPNDLKFMVLINEFGEQRLQWSIL
jgi:G3E family GTPase